MEHRVHGMGEPMSWYVGGEGEYYEVPFHGECPTCGSLLVDEPECTVCAEDEYYRELRDGEAA
jgi:hypothetical protein